MPDKLQIGVNVNTRVPIIYPESYTAENMYEMAEEVERLGFDSVWCGDNFFEKARVESTTTLAACASRTRRVKLSTASFILTTRHTVWMALTWASLDQLSGGRMIMTVCVGGGSPEAGGIQAYEQYELVGVPYRKRGFYMEEQIKLLRRLWLESDVHHQSEMPFHTLNGISVDVRPVQKPIPIWISNNPQIFQVKPHVKERMMRRVGELADGWQTCTATPAEYEELFGMVKGYARDAGRNPDDIVGAYQLTCSLRPNREQGKKEALDFLNKYYVTEFTDLSQSMWSRDPFGTPDDVIRNIEGLVEKGCRHFCVRFATYDQLSHLRLFAEKVLPSFK
ncbi:MAG: LLM class flavin-dependent oxidoreductase [Nitrospinota bacterium]